MCTVLLANTHIPSRGGGLIYQVKMILMYCQRRADFFSFQFHICIPVRMDRKSKYNPDRLCYTFGNVVLPNRG